MKEQWQLQYWVLAGHGRGGTLAAELARTLLPRVKGVVLMAAPMPLHVDMVNLNVFVTVLYGQMDTVVNPKAVETSFARMPGSHSFQTSYGRLQETLGIFVVFCTGERTFGIIVFQIKKNIDNK